MATCFYCESGECVLDHDGKWCSGAFNFVQRIEAAVCLGPNRDVSVSMGIGWVVASAFWEVRWSCGAVCLRCWKHILYRINLIAKIWKINDA